MSYPVIQIPDKINESKTNKIKFKNIFCTHSQNVKKQKKNSIIIHSFDFINNTTFIKNNLNFLSYQETICIVCFFLNFLNQTKKNILFIPVAKEVYYQNLSIFFFFCLNSFFYRSNRFKLIVKQCNMSVCSFIHSQMRLVILETSSSVGEWAAKYVMKRIRDFNPGPDR
jgi:DNA-directed RNA polymerase